MHAVQSHHRAIMRNVELIVASGAKFPCLTQQYTALHRAHIAAGSTQLSQAQQEDIVRTHFRLLVSAMCAELASRTSHVACVAHRWHRMSSSKRKLRHRCGW